MQYGESANILQIKGGQSLLSGRFFSKTGQGYWFWTLTPACLHFRVIPFMYSLASGEPHRKFWRGGRQVRWNLFVGCPSAKTISTSVYAPSECFKYQLGSRLSSHRLLIKRCGKSRDWKMLACRHACFEDGYPSYPIVGALASRFLNVYVCR